LPPGYARGKNRRTRHASNHSYIAPSTARRISLYPS